jgi:hypothetical protein
MPFPVIITNKTSPALFAQTDSSNALGALAIHSWLRRHMRKPWNRRLARRRSDAHFESGSLGGATGTVRLPPALRDARGTKRNCAIWACAWHSPTAECRSNSDVSNYCAKRSTSAVGQKHSQRPLWNMAASSLLVAKKRTPRPPLLRVKKDPFGGLPRTLRSRPNSRTTSESSRKGSSWPNQPW